MQFLLLKPLQMLLKVNLSLNLLYLIVPPNSLLILPPTNLLSTVKTIFGLVGDYTLMIILCTSTVWSGWELYNVEIRYNAKTVTLLNYIICLYMIHLLASILSQIMLESLTLYSMRPPISR